MAGNTPFRRWKREVHEGGVADPCIVRWPARFAGDAGEIRRQFAHAIDVMPTVLDLIGVEATRSHPRPGAEPDRRHELRPPVRRRRCDRTRSPDDAVLRDARFARALPRRLEGRDVQAARPDHRRHRRQHVHAPFDEDIWELYHVEDDFSEVHDLAERGARAARPHDRGVVGGGGAATTCCRSTTGSSSRSSNPPPNRILERSRYRYVPFGAPVPREHRRRRAQPEPRDHRVGGRPRRDDAGGCAARDRAACSGGGRSRCSTAGCATCTTSTASDRRDRVGPTGRRRRAHARLPVREARRRGWSRRAARRRRGRRRGRDPEVHAHAATRTPAPG